MENKFKKELTDKLTAELDALLNSKTIPVSGYAMALVKDGKIAFEHCAGFRRLDEGKPAETWPMTMESRYRIASISKVFTALGIMQLYDIGKLDIDEDVSKYLGFSFRNPNYPDKVINLRQILSHVSSVRDGSAYTFSSKYSMRDAFEPGGAIYNNGEHWASPDEGRSSRAPGDYFLYSNLNFGICGTIIERLTGERFDNYMTAHVLGPLGAKASFNLGDFDKDEILNVSEIFKTVKPDGSWNPEGVWTAQMDTYKGVVQRKNVISINNPDLGTANYDEDVSSYVPGTNGTIFSPQGGLRISARELAMTLEMFLRGGVAANGNRIISEKALTAMKTPVWAYDPALDNKDMSDSFCSCGSGLNIVAAKIGGEYMVPGREDLVFYGHTGSAYGLISAMYFCPEHNLGFAYAINGLGHEDCASSPEEDLKNLGTNRCIWHKKFVAGICELFEKEGLL